jgi:ubiquinone/menaquinone biosynthesis C-methylase UbiE
MRDPCTVTAPANPFAAADVGTVYSRGRPYHHPRTLGRMPEELRSAPVRHGLDIACGTGMSTRALAELAEHAVGVDISPEMLRAAPPTPRVSHMLGSADGLPFPAAVFGAATCCSGLHWFDQARFFAELRRVLVPGAWVALYDHYFMRIRTCPGYKAWVGELFERYPLPPRNPQVGDPAVEVPDGFELVMNEIFDDDITMTREQFVDYQMTVSHCVAAVDRGAPPAEVRGWLLESTEPLFEGSARTVRFLGALTCLRRLP